VQRFDYTGESRNSPEEVKNKPSNLAVMPGITARFEGCG
jgi:hypothetical protein